jgi:hypothetical protein
MSISTAPTGLEPDRAAGAAGLGKSSGSSSDRLNGMSMPAGRGAGGGGSAAESTASKTVLHRAQRTFLPRNSSGKRSFSAHLGQVVTVAIVNSLGQ